MSAMAVDAPPSNGHLPHEENGVHEHAKEPKFASGLILPPPDIKCTHNITHIPTTITDNNIRLLVIAVIDRTAAFVARSANPPQFEDKIRENQRQDPKFSFLNPADPYHAYYRHYMDKVNRGEVDDEQKPEKTTEKQEEKPVEVVDRGLEPPVPEFILDVSNVNAVDL